MKKSKILVALVAMLALSLGFVSCSSDSDDDDGGSGKSDITQITTQGSNPVRSASVAATSSSVVLAWAKPSDTSNYGGVKISWDTGSYTADADTTTYTVSSLSAGTSYTFTLTTLDSEKAETSSVVTITVKTPASSSGSVSGDPMKIALSVPEDATNTTLTVTATITTDGTVEKVVYKKDGSINAATLLADDDAETLTVDGSDNSKWTFTLTATDETSNGTYTVAAIDSVGREETASILISNFDFTAPANVTGVSATYDSETSTITLKWTDPSDSDFDHVLISYITNDGESDSDESTAVSVASGTQTYTLSNVSSEVQYYKFTLKSVDVLGNTSSGLSKLPEGFVAVSGGTFDGTSTLTPSSNVFISGRSITIGDLYVCDHEVTQGEYETYCKYGSDEPNSSYGDGDNYPAYYVSWYDAIVYCNLRSIAEGLTPVYSISNETDPSKWTGIVSETTDGTTKYCGPSSSNTTWDSVSFDTTANGYRLPTEAEWEYVARGGNKDSYTYSGSDTIGDVAWYTDNSSSSTHEVKTKAANSLGIYDMSGNVYEWCYDWYDSISTSTDATGAASGSSRVERGGSWYNIASYCAVSDRNGHLPYYRGSSVGFRVVRNAK